MSSAADKVYNAIRQIPKGKVSTYGKIGEYIGYPKGGRMVGKILHSNPDPNTIKCHRVVFKDGSLSQSFAFGGIQKQAQLLISEGISLNKQKNKIINIQNYLVQW